MQTYETANLAPRDIADLSSLRAVTSTGVRKTALVPFSPLAPSLTQPHAPRTHALFREHVASTTAHADPRCSRPDAN